MLNFTAPATLAAEDVANELPTAAQVRGYSKFLQMLKDGEALLQNHPTVFVHNPVNLGGAEDFKFIEFTVLDRWDQDGVTWVGGTRFAVNLDDLIDTYDSLGIQMMAARGTKSAIGYLTAHLEAGN